MCVPGQELALLVRVAIDREVEEVRAGCRSSSAACCPCPARRSRRSSCRASCASIRNASSLRLVCLHLLAEPAVALEVCEAVVALALRAAH